MIEAPLLFCTHQVRGGTVSPEGNEALNCTDSLGRTQTGSGEIEILPEPTRTVAEAKVSESSTLVARTLIVYAFAMLVGAV